MNRQTNLNLISPGNSYDTAVYEAYGRHTADIEYDIGANPAIHQDQAGFGGQYGYYTDRETGLLCLTHRYYDPGTGRFGMTGWSVLLGTGKICEMIENDEIFRMLGFDMILIDKQKLSGLDIPTSAKDWLETIGMPKQAQLPYGLICNGSDQVESIVTKSKSGAVVGESEGPTYIVVREDGVVVLVDKFDDAETYMNTTVGQFIMSLCKFADLTQCKLTINDFQSYLSEIDNDAAANTESFWSVAIEDMLNLQL